MKTKFSFKIPHRARVLGAYIIIAVFGLALSVTATDRPPEFMTYQGFLVEEDSSTPLGKDSPANYDVVFSIHKKPTGNDPLWSEQQTVTVDKGYFSVLLGEGTDTLPGTSPALSAVFAGVDASDRFIDIEVLGIGAGGGNVSLLPRLKLVSSPYAFSATRASILGDGTGGSDIVTVASGTGINVDGSVTATTSLTVPTVNATTVNAVSGNGITPLGGIIMWSGSSIPAGWALCNGGTVNGRTTPDLRDRFIVGTGWTYGVGYTGGANTVALSVSQMPSHNHSVTVNSGGTHHHEIRTDNGGGGSFGGAYAPGMIQANSVAAANANGKASTDYDGSHSHSASGGYKGSGSTHENRPPYYGLAFIMRVQ